MSPGFPVFILCILATLQGIAQSSGFGVYQPDPHVACLSPVQHAAIERQLEASRTSLIQQGILPAHDLAQRMVTLFSWPVEQHNGLDDYGVHGISNFVDQNPNTPNQILDYNCGTRSYDLASGYNHGGIDIFLWPFAWYKMDHDQVMVVAAAPGIIIYKSDGNFDRNCGFNNDNWNAVYVQHEDGSVAWYGHLKSGSVSTKDVGLSVERGEYLGIVGSSGSSTAPHLHFEIRNAAGGLVDPYAGPCNVLNSESWWIEQRPYYDSGINALRTQSAPTDFPACPQTETPFEQNTFCAGDVVYFVNYLRDQLPDQSVHYTVRRPNDALWQEWEQFFTAHYSASWWWWNYTLPVVAQTGTWTFRAEYEGEIYERVFDVIGLTVIETDLIALCPGDSVMLRAPIGTFGFEYQWRLNGINIEGATAAEFTATQGGNYTVVVSSPGLCSRTSNTLTITELPGPNIETDPPVGPVFICAGTTLSLCAEPFLNYVWSTGEVTECITVGPGDYIATVTNQHGCTSATMPVTVWEIDNPVVDLGPDTVTSDLPVVLDAGNAGLIHLWNTGESAQTILAEETGWYSVIVIDDNGCAGIDSIFVDILFVDVNDVDDEVITIRPNPFDQQVSISLTALQSPVALTIFDCTGRLVGSERITEKQSAIEVDHLTNGIYFFHFRAGNMQRIFRMVRLQE